MFRSLSRLVAEAVVFVGAAVELTLLAFLLPGDAANAPVSGVLLAMVLVAGITALLALPLWLAGRVRA